MPSTRAEPRSQPSPRSATLRGAVHTLPALLELLALDRLPRTGWLQAGVPAPECVAAHSLGVSLISLALAPEVEPPLDVDRCCALASVHDAPEAWLGDIPRTGARLLPEGAKRAAEERAALELLGGLSETACERWAEYEAGQTREARFVRTCDRLALGVRALGYHKAGLGQLGSFRTSIEQLDCEEFAPCSRLREDLLQAWIEVPPTS